MTRNNADFKQSAWFHGSGAVLNPGDRLVSGKELGINNFPPEGDNSAVWVSSKAHYAKSWGDRAAKRNGANVHVYEVAPDTEPELVGNKGHRTTGATVIRKIETTKAKK